MSPALGRDIAGQFAPVTHSAPDVTLASEMDLEGLRGTLEDFLEGALPGFGFTVVTENIEFAVDHILAELVEAHSRA